MGVFICCPKRDKKVPQWLFFWWGISIWRLGEVKGSVQKWVQSMNRPFNLWGAFQNYALKFTPSINFWIYLTQDFQRVGGCKNCRYKLQKELCPNHGMKSPVLSIFVTLPLCSSWFQDSAGMNFALIMVWNHRCYPSWWHCHCVPLGFKILPVCRCPKIFYSFPINFINCSITPPPSLKLHLLHPHACPHSISHILWQSLIKS
jgi:hypothetical protein